MINIHFQTKYYLNWVASCRRSDVWWTMFSIWCLMDDIGIFRIHPTTDIIVNLYKVSSRSWLWMTTYNSNKWTKSRREYSNNKFLFRQSKKCLLMFINTYLMRFRYYWRLASKASTGGLYLVPVIICSKQNEFIYTVKLW